MDELPQKAGALLTEDSVSYERRFWKCQKLEAAIEAGRAFWQAYAPLANDLPDDERGYFKQCSYLAGRFADALRGLE